MHSYLGNYFYHTRTFELYYLNWILMSTLSVYHMLYLCIKYSSQFLTMTIMNIDLAFSYLSVKSAYLASQYFPNSEPSLMSIFHCHLLPLLMFIYFLKLLNLIF